jgi:hypothetical protein
VWGLTAYSELNQSCLRLSDFVAVALFPASPTPLMRDDIDGRDARAHHENAREHRDDRALRTPGWRTVRSSRHAFDT